MIKATILFAITALISLQAEAQLSDESIHTGGKDIYLQKDTMGYFKVFKGQYKEERTLLTWVGSSMKQAGTFLISRSTDEINYEIIGVKQSMPSPAYSDAIYFFIDQKSSGKTTYYYKVVHLAQNNTWFESKVLDITPPFANISTKAE